MSNNGHFRRKSLIAEVIFFLFFFVLGGPLSCLEYFVLEGHVTVAEMKRQMVSYLFYGFSDLIPYALFYIFAVRRLLLNRRFLPFVFSVPAFLLFLNCCKIFTYWLLAHLPLLPAEIRDQAAGFLTAKVPVHFSIVYVFRDVLAIDRLDHYLPPGAYRLVAQYLHAYKIHLTITRSRKTVLGDYRHATGSDHHRISVNGNLNVYAFLITLIHELGHLITFQQHKNRVQAHGREWKEAYRKVLEDFLALNLFPADIRKTLLDSLHNLPASSCSDLNLTRVLRKYDTGTENEKLVEEVPDGAFFETEDGRQFRKGKKVRKRIECVETATGKLYLFSPVYAVKQL